MVYSFAPLSGNQQHVEERLRTLSLCVCALAAVVGTLYVLRSVLVPFVLAVAMRYLLQPLVITLTQRPLHCGGVVLCSEEPCGPSRPWWLRSLGAFLCHLQLPHWLAVVVTLAVAFTLLGVFGVVIADSVRLFAARADSYAAQVRRLCAGVLGWLDTSAVGVVAESPIQQLYQRLTELASRLPLSQLILNSVEVAPSHSTAASHPCVCYAAHPLLTLVGPMAPLRRWCSRSSPTSSSCCSSQSTCCSAGTRTRMSTSRATR